MVQWRTSRSETRRDVTNDYEKLGLWECHVQDNLPSPIRQVRVPILHVITPIQCLPNLIKQVVSQISQLRSYPPHRSLLHPPFLCFVHKSLIIAEQKGKLSLSIIPCHGHELTPSTAYTKSTTYTQYSIHRVQHLPKIVSLPFILIITS